MMTQETSTPPRANTIKARWSKLTLFAAKARQHRGLFWASAIIAIAYNLLGVLDVMTTFYGLEAKVATEGNPFIAALMTSLSHGWILVKLALQLLVTFMILWFPHKLVLSIFSIAFLITGAAVINNMHISGMF